MSDFKNRAELLIYVLDGNKVINDDDIIVSLSQEGELKDQNGMVWNLSTVDYWKKYIEPNESKYLYRYYYKDAGPWFESDCFESREYIEENGYQISDGPFIEVDGKLERVK